MILLETKRLLLRQPKKEDCEAMLEIHNSIFVLRYNAMKKNSKEEMLQEIINSKNHSLYLEEKKTGIVIGAISLGKDSLRYQVSSVCISYYVGERYAKMGFMSEALEALLPWLFEQGYLVISARVFSENSASIALLKKLGFQQEGYLRKAVRGFGNQIHDDVLFSLFKDEYKNRN